MLLSISTIKTDNGWSRSSPELTEFHFPRYFKNIEFYRYQPSSEPYQGKFYRLKGIHVDVSIAIFGSGNRSQMTHQWCLSDWPPIDWSFVCLSILYPLADHYLNIAIVITILLRKDNLLIFIDISSMIIKASMCPDLAKIDSHNFTIWISSGLCKTYSHRRFLWLRISPRDW